jgi:D-aspartate ligase
LAATQREPPRSGASDVGDRGAPGALVLGADLRALAVARSLGRREIAVWLVDGTGEDRVARSSRYARKVLCAPVGNSERQLDRLLAMAERHRLRGWTLFPTGDESVAALAHVHARLAETFTLSSPPWEVLRHVYHKRLSYRLAGRAGVEHPWTCHPRTLAEVAALRCEFPVVLKPDVKVRENRFTSAKAWRVDDRDSLLRAWQQASALVGAEAVMVQELVPGSGEAQYSYAALCQEGSVLASLVARRTRQYPRDFGHSSSFVETIDEPAVEERGRAIVAELRWSGLVEVELKHDARDGSYKLLDINGRVWTWHGLGAHAGVDFPYLAWRLAQGMRVTPVRARPGVRWVRLATDIPSALGAVAAGELSLRGWINSLQGPRTGALFAIDDPLPSLFDPALVARRLIRRASKPFVWVRG